MENLRGLDCHHLPPTPPASDEEDSEEDDNDVVIVYDCRPSGGAVGDVIMTAH